MADAGENEALQWGKFRSGGVTIAAGTEYMPAVPEILEELFVAMVEESLALPDCYDQAISGFLTMARQQFFYDVNKRQ